VKFAGKTCRRTAASGDSPSFRVPICIDDVKPAHRSAFETKQVRGKVRTNDQRRPPMANAIEATTAIQEKVYSAMQVSQKAMIDSVKSWAETVETVYAKLPDYVTTDTSKPNQLFETTLGFSERVMTSQQAFTTKLFEAMIPATRAATAAANSAPKPRT